MRPILAPILAPIFLISELSFRKIGSIFGSVFGWWIGSFLGAWRWDRATKIGATAPKNWSHAWGESKLLVPDVYGLSPDCSVQPCCQPSRQQCSQMQMPIDQFVWWSSQGVKFWGCRPCWAKSLLKLKGRTKLYVTISGRRGAEICSLPFGETKGRRNLYFAIWGKRVRRNL